MASMTGLSSALALLRESEICKLFWQTSHNSVIVIFDILIHLQQELELLTKKTEKGFSIGFDFLQTLRNFILEKKKELQYNYQ